MTREELIEILVEESLKDKAGKLAHKAYYGDPLYAIYREKGINAHPSGAAKLRREVDVVRGYGRRGSTTISKTTREKVPTVPGQFENFKKQFRTKAKDILVLDRVRHGRRTKKMEPHY